MLNGASPAHYAQSPAAMRPSPNGKHSPGQAPPSPPKMGHTATTPQPGSSAGHDPSTSLPGAPKRRKQKIEYVPWSKPLTESVGGFSLAFREQTAAQIYHKVRRRTVHDLGECSARSLRSWMNSALTGRACLGNVDFVTLRLSLQSGLATEVAPVLNSVNILAEACRTASNDTGIIFNQSQMEDVSALYEALVDHLRDCAFPVVPAPAATTSSEQQQQRSKGKGKASTDRPYAPSTYEDLWLLATQHEIAIKPARKRKQCGSLPPSEVVLSIVNCLRTFSFTVNLAPLMAKHHKTLDLLLRLCDFPAASTGPLSDADGRPLRSVVALSYADLLAVRKDAVVLIAQIGLQIEVDKLPRRTARQIFDLLLFFLSQPSDVDLPGSFGGSPAGRAALRMGSYGTYTEAALTALSQVATRDGNRETFGSLASPSQVFDLFDALFQCLPITDEDVQGLLQHPMESIYRFERLALCLYNLAFLAPAEVKNRIRQRPGFARVILTIIGKFQALSGAGSVAAREFSVFCRRLLELMDILSKSPDAAESYYDPLAPFFGGAFAGGVSGERREREAQSERRLLGEAVEAPRAEDLPSMTSYSPGMMELLVGQGHDPSVYNLLAKLL